MRRQVKRLGIGMLVLYGALFVQLNVVQVLRAQEYNDSPLNNRQISRDFSRPRGRILAADGTVLAESEQTDGGRFERRRVYPPETAELFAHTVGYFTFSAGADGVERTYTDELAGRGASVGADDVLDLLVDDDRTGDVRLTLSPAVQRVARDELGDRVGSVVALDPRDGSIIAMWSFPSYDPNSVAQLDQEASQRALDLLNAAESKPLLPRTYRETFFPGSTFKVVTAAAGLSSGTIIPSDTFPVSTEYLPPRTTRPIRNFGGGTCGGNLFDVLRVSCNTSFAQLGVDMGAGNLVEQAEDFGFNSRPPLDLTAVATSTIGGEGEFVENEPVLAQTAIGQNLVRASPLQMALVAGGIGNGGEIMVPHVLADVRDDEGEVVETFDVRPWRQAADPNVAALVRDAMVGVVRDGTATRLAVPDVTTAGKTGTAQLGDGTSHAWIIGFAPAEAPRVAVAVIVEAQQGASEQTGGQVAAPIGRAVLEAALRAVPE